MQLQIHNTHIKNIKFMYNQILVQEEAAEAWQ